MLVFWDSVPEPNILLFFDDVDKLIRLIRYIRGTKEMGMILRPGASGIRVHLWPSSLSQVEDHRYVFMIPDTHFFWYRESCVSNLEQNACQNLSESNG
jgi:hypothetical protein